ncbi:PQQ-dependent sugar dehydrogenase [Sorangium sp. So ce448]|uniref:PQQ-dependent sugar dehydrogenase n=1 Tax=Sorangium sp. So ce448 TaxID=3133314 RepID=UPI003F5EA944
MMDQKRFLLSFMPIAAALFGLGFTLNGCGGSDNSAGTGGGGGGGTGPGGPGSGGGTSSGAPTSSGSGANTSTSTGTNTSTSTGTNASTSGPGSTTSTGAGTGPATSAGSGAGGSGTIECDEPGGTVPPLKLTEVVNGFDRPLHVTSEPADASRLYVIEQVGRIRLVKNGALQDEPFLDITGLVTPVDTGYDDEKGLLGLTFHPDYAENGRFFVYFNARRQGDVATGLTLMEFSRSPSNPDVAVAESKRSYFRITSGVMGNHNGGMLAFGPDRMLYIGVGDGGGQTDNPDPNNNGQNIEVKLGKILRIDVDNHPTAPAGNVTGGDPDVWDYGLRNPWRFSFDRCRGDLYIGDVGGRLFEEINVEPRGQGKKNYGWSVTEGGTCIQQDQATPCNSPTITAPIVTYDHDNGDGSVTGGYVYRGSRIPALRGKYLFGDYASDRVWMLTWKDGVATPRSSLSQDLASESTIQGLASFGEDAAGELYIVSYGGSIFRIDPE